VQKEGGYQGQKEGVVRKPPPRWAGGCVVHWVEIPFLELERTEGHAFKGPRVAVPISSHLLSEASVEGSHSLPSVLFSPTVSPVASSLHSGHCRSLGSTT
jgi:hypothetical protein